MKIHGARYATLITWLLILLPPILLLLPALRPGFILMPANLPYLLDPLWQPVASPATMADANPVLSDQFYQYHAWKTVLRQALDQGELPWWTPAVNGGQPLLANGQVGLLAPTNLLAMLFPLVTSYVVGALLRLWIAAAFTYAYARQIGLSRLAAWLALLVFTFSGPLINWLGATPSHILIWFPALLWVGEKCLAEGDLRWALLASALLALLLFSSQPEIAFQVGVVWGIYLLLRASWLEGGLLSGVRRHAQWWLVVALLGVTLAAVELFPFVDALRHSVVFSHRLESPPFNFALWLRHTLISWQEWPTLITTLLPNFLGREQDGSYWYPTGNSIENSAYAGVLPLLLSLLALWTVWRNQADAQRRWIWLWGGIGLGTLALAVGLPIVNALNDLPPFNLMEAGRFRGIYGFAVAILASFGFDLLRTNPNLHRPFLWLLASAAAINVLLVAAAYAGFSYFADQLIASGRAFMETNVGTPSLDRPLAELYALVEARQQAKIAMLLPSNPVMYIPLIVACVVGVLLWLRHTGRLAMAWLAPALLLVAWLDLLSIGSGINAIVPTTLLETKSPAIEFLQSQPQPFRVVGSQLILNPNMSMLTQLEDVRGYDPMAANRYRGLLAGMDGFAPSGYHNYFRHLDDPRLDLLNATYGLSRTPPTAARWEPVFADPSGVTVYHSRTALPRAYLVYAAEVVANGEQSLARTLDPSFDPRQSVVLEEQPTGWIAPAGAPNKIGDVQFGKHRATSLQLEVNTVIPALLVLVESYAPGWRATVDQQPTPIYVANHAFRAVTIPAGQHTVEFTYSPPLLMTGIATSTGAAIVVLVLLIWMYFAKQKAKEKQGRLP